MQQLADAFGDITTETNDFWLGSDNIHRMTSLRPFLLRFELTYKGGVNTSVYVHGFTLGSKSNDYFMRYDADSLVGSTYIDGT